jgi:hypothetical protein
MNFQIPFVHKAEHKEKIVLALSFAAVCFVAQEARAYPDCPANQRAYVVCECHSGLSYRICAPGQTCTDSTSGGFCVGVSNTFQTQPKKKSKVKSE